MLGFKKIAQTLAQLRYLYTIERSKRKQLFSTHRTNSRIVCDCIRAAPFLYGMDTTGPALEKLFGQPHNWA